MKKLILYALVVLAGWQVFMTPNDTPIVLDGGIKAAKPPIQTKALGTKPFDYQGYTITPLAHFIVTAKVLGRKNYYLGRESDISPVDFALGWQAMSDQRIIDQVNIKQSGRWYHWSVKQFPVPRRTIETQSANMHLIPDNGDIGKKLDTIRTGQIISLSGYLVQVAAEGWTWTSSLTRDDVGSHACEVMYVTSVNIIE